MKDTKEAFVVAAPWENLIECYNTALKSNCVTKVEADKITYTPKDRNEPIYDLCGMETSYPTNKTYRAFQKLAEKLEEDPKNTYKDGYSTYLSYLGDEKLQPYIEDFSKEFKNRFPNAFVEAKPEKIYAGSRQTTVKKEIDV